MSTRLERWMRAAVAFVCSSGCASLPNGTTQRVAFGSVPWRATVSVDSQVIGLTPIAASLSRKCEHTVRIELEGYQPFETTLHRRA